MEHQCVQCSGVLLRGSDGNDGSGQGRCQEHFRVEGFEHLGVLCSQSCGNLFLERSFGTPELIQGKKTTRAQHEGGEQEDPEAQFIEYIKNNDLDTVRDLARQYSRNQIPVQYCRSKEMFRMLVVEFEADPYAFIGKGQVALEECMKYFSVTEVMQDTISDNPEIQADIKEALAAMDNETGRVKINVRKYFDNGKNGLVKEWKGNLECLIWNGVIPDIPKPETQKKLEDIFFQKYDGNTFSFWTMDRPEWFIKFIDMQPWYYYTVFGAQKYATETANSFPLLILDPGSLYFQSRRPKTDMSMFKTAQAKILKEVPVERGSYFPVTRYAAEVSGSLFYRKDTKKSYCGTFYYLEPESHCFIYFKNPLVVRNKLEAFHQVYEGNLDSFDVRFKDQLKTAKELLPPWEYSDLYLYPKDTGAKVSSIVQQDRDFYGAFALRLYALEDFLDQPICEYGRKKGHDGIILTHMVGSRQIVGEVLDTRPREESLQNLYFVEKQKRALYFFLKE